jgi:hypothetical protein
VATEPRTTSQDSLKTVYEWRHSQATTLATGCFSLAGLILSPLLAAVFDKGGVETWQACLFVTGAVLSAGCGAAWHREAARLQKCFLRKSSGAPRDVADEEVWF